MIDKVEEIKKAKSQIVQGSLTIWNARLDALQRSGDLYGALEQLITPAEAGIFDNCDCNHKCGSIDTPLPKELAASKKR
jgi:hypothetical protein